MKKTLDIKDLNGQVSAYRYVFAFISTAFSNSDALAVSVEAFDDTDELEGIEEDLLSDMLALEAGDTTISENGWTIVRIK